MIRKLIALSILFFVTAKTLAQDPSPKGEQAKQSTASKQVSTFIIEAPQLKTTKKIWIYLPKNYDASKKKYPVIYMHDAQNIFDAKTSFVGEWNVDETLDSINAQVIVIGIENNQKHSCINVGDIILFSKKQPVTSVDKFFEIAKTSEKRQLTVYRLNSKEEFELIDLYPVQTDPKIGVCNLFE